MFILSSQLNFWQSRFKSGDGPIRIGIIGKVSFPVVLLHVSRAYLHDYSPWLLVSPSGSKKSLLHTGWYTP